MIAVEINLVPYHCPTMLVFRSLQSRHLFVVGRRASLGSGCCSPSSLSSLGTCFSSPYQDLAKHIVNTSMADVSLCAYLFPLPVAMARLMLDGEGKKPGRLGPPRYGSFNNSSS